MNKKNFALMGNIIAAMAVEATPFLMTSEASTAQLLKDGMVEVNGEIRDGDKVATRATEKGIAAYNEQNAAASGGGDTGASQFEIITNAVLPTTRGGGRSGSNYPFDKLEVGNGFFIPATTERPNPAKSLASTVSAASKQFATDTGKTKTTPKGNTVPVFEYTRKFTIKAVKGGVALGEFTPPTDGAFIARTA